MPTCIELVMPVLLATYIIQVPVAPVVVVLDVLREKLPVTELPRVMAAELSDVAIDVGALFTSRCSAAELLDEAAKLLLPV